MNKQDYQIVIQFDIHGEPYYNVYYKNDRTLCDNETFKMASEAMRELADMIDKRPCKKRPFNQMVLEIPEDDFEKKRKEYFDMLLSAGIKEGTWDAALIWKQAVLLTKMYYSTNETMATMVIEESNQNDNDE